MWGGVEMRRLILEVIYTTGAVLILLGIVIFIHAYMTRHKPVVKMTHQEIILECEKLSAVATNEGWSYKSCVENLDDTKPRILGI